MNRFSWNCHSLTPCISNSPHQPFFLETEFKETFHIWQKQGQAQAEKNTNPFMETKFRETLHTWQKQGQKVKIWIHTPHHQWQERDHNSPQPNCYNLVGATDGMVYKFKSLLSGLIFVMCEGSLWTLIPRMGWCSFLWTQFQEKGSVWSVENERG